MNENALYAQDYYVERRLNEPPRVQVNFIIPISPHKVKEIAEILKRIELFLNNKEGIALVQGNQKPRCFYCGTLNEEINNSCSQCGAPL